MTFINDGKGSGSLAGVTVDNHVLVSGRVETPEDHAVELGLAYNINTGTIGLTSANESALLYLVNTSTKEWENRAVIFLLGNSNITGEDWFLKTYHGPTALSGSTAFLPVNRNIGSSKTLTATCEFGAEASAFTGGTVAVQSIVTGPGRQVVAVSLRIPPGTSIGCSIEPPTGNTGCDVQVAFPVYEPSEAL